MAICKKWAGRLFGTNTGNLFATLSGEDKELTGRIHLNDPAFGIVVYQLTGAFDGHSLSLKGVPEHAGEDVILGNLAAEARLNSKGTLDGDWSTDIGAAGTFVLHPHDQTQSIEKSQDDKKDQLHTARHDFRALAVDREQLILLAEEIQAEFTLAKVVITTLSGTEKSMFLDDFKEASTKNEKAALFRLFVREAQDGGTDRIVSVEFGPQMNFAMTQDTDESWVLGMLEKLKKSIGPLERFYPTTYQKYGIGFNQIFLLSALVYLPNISDTLFRYGLVAFVLIMIWIITELHKHYAPFSALYMGSMPKGLFSKFLPVAFSWTMAATSALAATALATYLESATK